MSDQPYLPPSDRDDRFATAPEPPPGTANPPGAVTALVLGIVAIVLAVTGILSPVAVILAIIALVFVGKARRAAEAAPEQFVQGGLRIGGFVCGLIGLILGLLYSLIIGAGIAFVVRAEVRRVKPPVTVTPIEVPAEQVAE